MQLARIHIQLTHSSFSISTHFFYMSNMTDLDPDRNVDFSTVEEIQKEKFFLENFISKYNEKIHDIDKKISVYRDKVLELIRLTKWLETDDQTKHYERVQAIINADTLSLNTLIFLSMSSISSLYLEIQFSKNFFSFRISSTVEKSTFLSGSESAMFDM